MTELDDDFYEFDEKNYCIVGRHHHKIYQLGDRVTIKVAKANLVARQLDYELVKGADEEGVIRPLGERAGKISAGNRKRKAGKRKINRKEKRENRDVKLDKLCNSFTICLLILVVGYFVYGRYVERVFGPEAKRPTPALTKADGVDYIPLPTWKIFMIQFLNIAGLGPIFGAIMGG